MSKLFISILMIVSLTEAKVMRFKHFDVRGKH